jgi:hypothetical protein
MESFPHGNLCVALRTSSKTTTKIRKTTEENLFLDSINYESCSAGASVEHSHEAMSDQIKKTAPFTILTLFKDLGGGNKER